jgi:hypothetical protein
MEATMKTNRLLIYLCCLGSLWLASCSPADTAPLSVTRPIAQTTVTDTAMPTNTPLPAATPTGTANTPSPAATDPAMPTWTREPSPTPTIQPTFTPIPGPVWPILFAGNPCPSSTGATYCNEQWPESGQWYQINSDGSNLRRIPQLDNPEPYDYYGLMIQQIRFSPDGDKIAYVAGNHIYLADLDNNDPIELVELPYNYSALLGGFDFMPDSNCLLTYWLSERDSQRTEVITLEQICPGQSDSEIVAVIPFPELRAGFSSGYLSPQGNALLINGWDNEDHRRLYIHELGSSVSPQLLFTMRQDEHEDAIYTNWALLAWHPDNLHIQFIFNSYLTRDRVAITHYLISRNEQVIEEKLLVEDSPLGLCCDWSPDGREVAIRISVDPPHASGIYIFNLDTTTWRHILPEFYISRGPFWSPDFP